MAHNQPQMYAETTMGRRVGQSRHALAADYQAQGGRVAFRGPSVFGLTDLLYNSGRCFGIGPFSQFSLRGGSSPDLREGDRLGSLPVAGRHPISRGGPEGVRFDGAPLFRRLYLKPTNHVCQDTSDWSENHSVKTLSVCGSYDQQTNTRGQTPCSRKTNIRLPIK